MNASAKILTEQTKRETNLSQGETAMRETIDKAKHGDVKAYETLYNLHRRQIFGLCLRYTRNVSDAEDLTQDVFMQMYRKVRTFRGDAKFGTWLYRIAFNFVLMYRRKGCQNQVPLSVVSEWSPYFACSHCAPIEVVALRQAINTLPKPRKNVFLLHDVRGLTHGEVARELGVTVGASRSQLHRAHRDLRDILGNG